MNAGNPHRIQLIHTALEALEPTEIEVIDESHLHAGHAGAKSGKGHFRLRIRSPRFVGKRPIQQHQMIYQCLADLMETEIHALSIDSGE